MGWVAQVAAADLPAGFHFHDLPHTGNHLAAESGASTRELMHRLGHSAMVAALHYQHPTDQLPARSRPSSARLWSAGGRIPSGTLTARSGRQIDGPGKLTARIPCEVGFRLVERVTRIELA